MRSLEVWVVAGEPSLYAHLLVSLPRRQLCDGMLRLLCDGGLYPKHLFANVISDYCCYLNLCAHWLLSFVLYPVPSSRIQHHLPADKRGTIRLQQGYGIKNAFVAI